ncbi:hypothetical protein CDAR_112981 [Caerostris darwini]|uniref:Uncharacterized protein n=1 Tax=Caerostris darwini TaxID=1538125 RepID=A0AAV4PZ51_9ARAC|nr:hypothetical protein CDAR_112981 [Caerostris darwini]
MESPPSANRIITIWQWNHHNLPVEWSQIRVILICQWNHQHLPIESPAPANGIITNWNHHHLPVESSQIGIIPICRWNHRHLPTELSPSIQVTESFLDDEL